MEKIHGNMRVLILSCAYTCISRQTCTFRAFFPFSDILPPNDIHVMVFCINLTFPFLFNPSPPLLPPPLTTTGSFLQHRRTVEELRTLRAENESPAEDARDDRAAKDGITRVERCH